MTVDETICGEDTALLWSTYQWRLDIHVSHAVAPDLLARLLATKPLWDPYLADHGLSLIFHSPKAKDDVPSAALDLALVRDVVAKAARGKLGRVKTTLSWQREPKVIDPVVRLGPMAFSIGKQDDLEGHLALPQLAPLSPRLKSWYGLALSAAATFLTPPPGAPTTKGGHTLIVDENPVIPALTALAHGSERVVTVCSEDYMARLTHLAAALNGLDSALETVLAPIPPWPKSLNRDWRGQFSLIVVNHSQHLASRLLKDLATWLAPEPSRIILTGIHTGTQSAYIIKAASKAGLSLQDTTMDGNWSVMNLVHRRSGELPVWDWSPGDLLKDINEDDKEAIERADRLDRRRIPKEEDDDEKEEDLTEEDQKEEHQKEGNNDSDDAATSPNDEAAISPQAESSIPAPDDLELSPRTIEPT
jgi:hypothetical protein